MRKYLGVVTCAILLGSLPGRAIAVEVKSFPFVKELAAPGQRIRDVGCAHLDDEVFVSTDGSYGNMRVFDSNGDEVRFVNRALVTTKKKTIYKTFEMKTLSFKELGGNRAEIVLERRTGQQVPASVDIITHQLNYEKEITVSGSPDQQGWIELAGRRPIFDYSKYIDVRNNRVDLKRRAFRYYRIVVSNLTEAHRSQLRRMTSSEGGGGESSATEEFTVRDENFRIEKMIFRYPKIIEVASNPVTKPYAITALESEDNDEMRKTFVTFRTSRQPITALTIETPAANFSREVRVEKSESIGEDADWQMLADNRISRVNIAGIKREDIEIELGGPVRSLFYRISIRNHDSPPLKITDVKAEGESRALFLITNSDTDYGLYYGARGMKPPRYDITDVLETVAEADTDLYSLSAQAENPEFSAEEERKPIGTKAIFTAALVIMAATLAWLIARAAKSLPEAE